MDLIILTLFILLIPPVYNPVHGCIPVLVVTRPIQGPPITDTDTEQLRLDYTEFDIERLKRHWKSFFSIKNNISEAC
jgi:hypothetical protein